MTVTRRRSLGRLFPNSRRNGRTERRRKLFRPLFENLEDRRLLATIVWDGAPDGGGSSANADWSNGDNWAGDVAPTTNDDLVFPVGAAQTINVNDFVGKSFGAMLIEGDNYDLSGNQVLLNAWVTNTGSNNTFGVDLKVGLSAGFVNTAGGTFTVAGAIDTNGQVLLLDTLSDTTVVSGVVSGSGGVSTGGNGVTVLSAANSYSGGTVVNADTLSIEDAAGLGFADGTLATGTTVTAGTLKLDGSFTVANELLTLDGPDQYSPSRLQSDGDGVWTGDVDIQGTTRFVVQNDQTLTMSGNMAGSANVQVQGGGRRVRCAAW